MLSLIELTTESGKFLMVNPMHIVKVETITQEDPASKQAIDFSVVTINIATVPDTVLVYETPTQIRNLVWNSQLTLNNL